MDASARTVSDAPPRRGPIDVPDRIARPVRRAARIWGAGVTSALLIAALAGRIPQSPDSRTFEAAAQVGLLAVAALGGVLAWRFEGVGGGILLVTGVGLGVLASLQWPPLVGLLVAAAFVLPAVAFLAVWQRSRTWRHLAVLGLACASVLAVGGVASARVYHHYFGAAHPQSDTVVATSSDVDWLWAGGVTDHGFRVTVRFATPRPDARLAVATATDLRDADHVAASSASEDRRTATFTVTGRSPDTMHHYAVVLDGDVDDGTRGRVATLPIGPSDLTLAVSSCARVGSDGAVYDRIRSLDPDLYVVSGDLHYGDIASPEPGAFYDVFDRTLAAPAQAALYRSVPVAYVWDDHDYGVNDGDRTAPARSAALAVYREATPHYDLALPGDEAPIAQATTLGRVRLLLTDLRSARDPAGDPHPSMLGAAQRDWFEQELRAAAGHYPLVVWVSSVPWIGEASAGADDWAGYAAERADIAQVIADSGVPVLILAGDAHMLAIDDGSHADYATGGHADITVFHAGALDRPGSVKGGPYSEGTHPGAGQFGVVTIHDDGGETIRIELSGRRWTGAEVVSHAYEIPTTSSAAHGEVDG